MGDTATGPFRIGVLLCVDDVNEEALRFLVLATNKQQRTFEYEFVPFSRDDPFIAPFFTGQTVNRRDSSSDAVMFSERVGAELTARSDYHGLGEPPPPHFIVITMVRFDDNYYSMRRGNISVIALGNWERYMAPPSLAEFILTLLARESVAAVSPRLTASVHLGTKGCLCDFRVFVRLVGEWRVPLSA